jgi:hypothetical protein
MIFFSKCPQGHFVLLTVFVYLVAVFGSCIAVEKQERQQVVQIF